MCRWLWVAVLAASAGCLGVLLAPAARGGAALSYTPDLRYLAWTTTFPAVTVCETFYATPAQRKFTDSTQYGQLLKNLSYNYRRYLTNLLYGLGSCTKEVCVPCGSTVSCDVLWRQIIEYSRFHYWSCHPIKACATYHTARLTVEEHFNGRLISRSGDVEWPPRSCDIHVSCEELLSSCAFNGAAFPCCAHFRAVDAEHGPCYSFNSLQLKNTSQEQLMTVNSTTGPGLLSFRLHHDAEISVHSPEELSTTNLDKKFKFDVKTREANWVEFLFSLVEMANDPLLKFEGLLVRGCRYLNEVYSYGSCKLAQSTEDSFYECGCVHPARDQSYKRSYCNYTGLNCLVTYEANKHKLGINKRTNHEPCLPSCSESELTTIHISKKWVVEDSESGTKVNIRMSSLPHLRYERQLLRSNLDLVVSIGGVIGLFFGASVLSMVEVCYLILRNP